jgi:DNA-binding XRE family transcriptional regulator
VDLNVLIQHASPMPIAKEFGAHTGPKKRDDPEERIDRAKLGLYIRELRRNKGISQEKFAGMADVPRPHMGAIEAGRIDIRFSTIRRIALALEVSLERLMRFAEVHLTEQEPTNEKRENTK